MTDQPNPYQLFPSLSEAAFENLKASIASYGILVPIEVDEAGAILDGHHRVRAWTELRAEGAKIPDYPRQLRRFGTEDEKVAHALRVNLVRRQLSAEDRATVASKLRARGWSLRRIAEHLDAGHATIARDLGRVPTETPDGIEGADGKRYPATKPVRTPSIVVHSTRDERRAIEAMTELGDEIPDKPMQLLRLEQRARHLRVRSGVQPDGSEHSGPSWRIDCEDVGQWEVPDNSVDLILTDPPYTNEAIPIFGTLGELASRVLKPGRLAIMYVGKLAIPDEIELLQEHLDYVWMGAVFQPGRPSRVHLHQIQGAYRPFLIMSNGPYKPRGWIRDAIHSTTPPKKAIHPWEQALAPFVQLVKEASKPGELVCDPFTGSGTTGVAALREGRSFLGCEIDPRTAAEAAERLGEEAAEVTERLRQEAENESA